MSTVKCKSGLVIGIVISMLFIGAFSNPIFQTVIAQLYDDEATDSAVERLENVLGNTIVIDPSSFWGRFLLMRAVVDVVWVGHGGVEGINTNEGFLEWEEFSSVIKSTAASKQYLASCYSSRILEEAPEVKRNLESSCLVNGIVDAELIAGWIAAHIQISRGDVDGARQTLHETLNSAVEKTLDGNIEPLVFGLPNFSENEFFWAAVGVGFLIISLLAGYGMGWALEEETIKAIGIMLAVGYGENLINLILLVVGWLTGGVSFIALVASLVTIVAAFVYYVIISIAWYNAWKAAALTVSVSCPYLTMIANIATALTVGVLLAGIASDILDDDPVASTFLG